MADLQVTKEHVSLRGKLRFSIEMKPDGKGGFLAPRRVEVEGSTAIGADLRSAVFRVSPNGVFALSDEQLGSIVEGLKQSRVDAFMATSRQPEAEKYPEI